MFKKIALSVLIAAFVLVLTWMYQNYDYTLKVEDKFIKKIFVLKDNVMPRPSKAKADFIFINTGKDLALVDDSLDYGQVAVSDREKILRLITYFNRLVHKPLYTVVDIQFYYPYTIQPVIDSLLEDELRKNGRCLIPILRIPWEGYKLPLYDVPYGYSNYQTFGSTFNKFRLMNRGPVSSIPRRMDEAINHSVYHDHFFWPTCNRRLCLSAMWPDFYLRNEDIVGLEQQVMLDKVKGTDGPRSKGNVTAQYYNLGELLFDLDADNSRYEDFFDNRIVILGNFEEDNHSTAVGQMAGPVLLANIYLSLANNEHIISPWLIVLVLAGFTWLSYISWFSRMPEFRFRIRFLFSGFVEKFIRGYVSYFGCLFFLSLFVLLLFDMQLPLFLPSFLFTAIEFVRQKKYKNNTATQANAPRTS